MVHISKQKVTKEVLKKLRVRFAESLSTIKDKKVTQAFLNELLTPAEELMLAKRLAAIYMLTEGISSYRIANTLKLSISTVLRLRSQFEDGSFDSIISVYVNKRYHNDFWQDIDALLRLGMPSRAGSDRWKWLHDLEDKYR